MYPDTKQEYRQFVIENGRVEERGQSHEEWLEEVEEEAQFEAEIQDGRDWEGLK
jgi:hypothetical protein